MFYFAYGSNMNLKQMQERCEGDFRVIGPARLDGYELGFDSRGYANIRSNDQEFVLGVLFKIGEFALGELDKHEGYNRDLKIYDREKIEVSTLEKKENFSAEVYIEKPIEFGGQANRAYLKDKIITGAKANNLPDFWIKKLESFLL